MSTQVHREDGRVATGVVVAIGAALAFVLLVVVGGTFFVRQVFSGGGGSSAEVTVESVLTPVPEGVRVRATVTAAGSALPDDLSVPQDDDEARFVSTTGERAQTGSTAAVSDLTVDGAAVDPGDTIHPSGVSVTFDYVIAARDDGSRVAYALFGLGGVTPTEVTARIEGDPSTCLVPEGRRFNQNYTWTSPCSGDPVTARRGPATATGYSDIEIPAWVRVAYAPA